LRNPSIAFLSVFPPYRGGISRFSEYLQTKLNKKTSSVRCFNYKKQYPTVFYPGTCQTTKDVSDNDIPGVFHPFNPFNWKTATRDILNSSPQIFLYSYWHPFFAPGIRSVLKNIGTKPKIKRVALAHNIYPHEPFCFQKFLAKKVFSQTDAIITLSNETCEEAKSLAPGKKVIKLFHPAFELSFPEKSSEVIREEHGFNSDDIILLFFGLIRKYKGLDIMIDALNQIDLKGYKIKPVIIGEFYIHKQSLLDRIDPGHLEMYTIVDRFVSVKEMAEYFTMADALILPHKNATQSGVLADAINFQVPVITSALPGLTQYLIENNHGLFFKPGSSQNLKKTILEFLDQNNKDQYRHHLQELKHKLSWESFTDELITTVQGI